LLSVAPREGLWIAVGGTDRTYRTYRTDRTYRAGTPSERKMDTWASSILHITTCVDLDLRIDVVTVDLDLRPFRPSRPPLWVRLLRRLRWVGVCVSFSSKPSNNNESD